MATARHPPSWRHCARVPSEQRRRRPGKRCSFDDLGLRQINELRVRRSILCFPICWKGKLLMLDKTLRQTIVDELDFEPSVDAANIGVALDNGIVTLTGHVAGYAEKVAAERAVQRVNSVRAKIEVRCPIYKQTADDQTAERTLTVALESRARSRLRASRLERYRELLAATRG